MKLPTYCQLDRARNRNHIQLQKVAHIDNHERAFEWKISCYLRLSISSKIDHHGWRPSEMGSGGVDWFTLAQRIGADW